MEVVFLLLLVVLMIVALSSGFPVAFALPGAAIIAIGLAALCGYLFAGDVSAYFAHGGPVEWLSAGVTNFRSLYWDVERDTLIAIPLFIFMGIMLQRSKVAEDLLVAMARLFGPVPGGLGISVVVVGALLAATTGIVGATVVAMGLISLPAMMRNNYSKSLACGTICASGTLGQIIPPSIVLIILSDQLSSAAAQASALRKADYKEATGEFSMPSAFDVSSASAGDMFMGALIPGLILVGLYVLYILVTAYLKPAMAPPVEGEEGERFDALFVRNLLMALLPPLLLIFTVLGSIIFGIATVNQAGAIGAVGALMMAGYRLVGPGKHRYTPLLLGVAALASIVILLQLFDLNIKNITNDADRMGVWLALLAVAVLMVSVLWSVWRTYKVEGALSEVMLETAKTTSMVFVILIGAAMLTSAFRGFGGEELVKDFLNGLPGGFWMQFIVVMLVIFLLGFFLDFIEIAVVVVPIVAPILLAHPEANVTAVWLGVMVGLNIQTSFLTPPFGFALFYLRGVASDVIKTLHIYRGAIPFIGLQILALVIVGFSPKLVNYLPNYTYLTSENAPPPINPRIQSCLEDYVFSRYESDGDAIRVAIARMQSQPMDFLPAKQQEALAGSLAQAAMTFELKQQVDQAVAAVNDYAQGYRPLHRQVRAIQSEIKDKQSEKMLMERDVRRLDGSPEYAAEVEVMRQQIATLDKQISELKTQIPAEWEAANGEYSKLAKAEQQARSRYRRNVDESYQAVGELSGVIASAAELEKRLKPLYLLNETLATGATAANVEVLTESFKEQERMLGELAGGSALRSDLAKIRRALKKVGDDFTEPQQDLEALIQTVEAEVNWRAQAQSSLLPALADYEDSVRNSIGLRQQARLSQEQAEAIASCQSSHRDISLYF